MTRTNRLTPLALAALLAPLPCFAQAPRPQRPPAQAPAPDGAALPLQVFAEVAERVVPSVVAIFVEIVEHNEMLLPMPGFFGAAPEEPAQRRSGAGSGVIVSADGAILTNNHVVNGATRIRVRLHDGRTFPARVLGVDPETDLAVIKVEASGLPVARMGDSDAARVGEWVLAVGAPFGLEATVTHGVLSAKGRGDFGVNAIEDYLQTDASINPGNSGGALVNLRGEVLGINTMVVSRGSGVGFAVPSRIARFVVQQAVTQGRIHRGWTGMTVQDITPDLVRDFGPSRSGVIVSNVLPGGPAARAGLRVGDLVTALDGIAVHSRHELLRETAVHGVNERLTLAVARGRERVAVTLTTTLRPGDSLRAPPAPVAPPEPGPTGFGVTIDAVPEFLARRLGIAAGVGVVVLEVRRGGAADRAGLRPGDVILQADGNPVRAPDDVIASARDGSAVWLVRRGLVQEFVGLNTGG